MRLEIVLKTHRCTERVEPITFGDRVTVTDDAGPFASIDLSAEGPSDFAVMTIDLRADDEAARDFAKRIGWLER